MRRLCDGGFWSSRSLFVCLLVAGALLAGLAQADEKQAQRPQLAVRGIYGGVPTTLMVDGKTLPGSGVDGVWLGERSITPARFQALKKQGARVFAEFNTLHRAEYLKEHPDAAPVGADGLRAEAPHGWQGICPTHEAYRRWRMDAFRRLLTEHALDGVWLDYHHAHASWERAEPALPDTCFCSHCLKQFQKDTQVDLKGLTPAQAAIRLLGPERKAWVAWRCAIFTDWVREFRSIRDATRPQALLGSFHCPWSDDERDGALRAKLGIDLRAQQEHLDVFSPMLYHARFGHASDPAWISRQTAWLGSFLAKEDMTAAKTRIWPIVQLRDWGEPVPPQQVEAVLDHGTRPPATGVMVFAWGGLQKQPEKVDAMVRFYRGLEPARDTPLKLAFQPGRTGGRLAPRYSPKGSRVPLATREAGAPEGHDALQGHLPLGPKALRGEGLRLVLARSAEGKPFDRLWIDTDGDGSLEDETVLRTAPRVSRGNVYTSYQAAVPVRHAAAESAEAESYAIGLWVAVPSEDTTPAFIRFSRRGFLVADVKLGETQHHIVISDGNNDAVYGVGDWWTILPAAGKATNDIAGARRVGDFAWSGDRAFKLELQGTRGREGRLSAFDPGLTPAEDARARDPYWDDKHAVKAEQPVQFLHEIESAIADAKKRNVPYYLDFETVWCGPCKSMDRWVYTAQEVVLATRGIVCIKVDGDKRKDLKDAHSVSAFPTGILFRPNGEEIARFTGYRGVAALCAFFAQAGSPPEAGK